MRTFCFRGCSIALIIIFFCALMHPVAARANEACCEGAGEFEAQIAGTILTLPTDISFRRCAATGEKPAETARGMCRDALRQAWSAVIAKPMEYFCKAACATMPARTPRTSETIALIRMVRARAQSAAVSAGETKECLTIYYCTCRGTAISPATENLDRAIRLTGDTRCMQTPQ